MTDSLWHWPALTAADEQRAVSPAASQPESPAVQDSDDDDDEDNGRRKRIPGGASAACSCRPPFVPKPHHVAVFAQIASGHFPWYKLGPHLH